MIPLEVLIPCAAVILLLILVLKCYPATRPEPCTLCNLPPVPVTVMGTSNLAVGSSQTAYHLARPTPVSKAPALSPIREEARPSGTPRMSNASSVQRGDTNSSLPQSPMVMTSLVSPFDGVCSPPSTMLTLPFVAIDSVSSSRVQVSPVPNNAKDSSFVFHSPKRNGRPKKTGNAPIKLKMTQKDTMRWGRTLLRFLQFALALVALATISHAFVGASYYGYSSMLGSGAATYTQLVTYTSMLVGLFLFLFVELLRYFKRPTPRLVEQLMDLVLAAMLVVAGIVLVVSDYVAHCSVYGYMLRCNLLKTAVVFSFLTAATHLASFLLSCSEDYGSKRDRTGSHSDYDSETGHGHPSAGYHAEATPTGASTPKDASNRV